MKTVAAGLLIKTGTTAAESLTEGGRSATSLKVIRDLSRSIPKLQTRSASLRVLPRRLYELSLRRPHLLPARWPLVLIARRTLNPTESGGLVTSLRAVHPQSPVQHNLV